MASGADAVGRDAVFQRLERRNRWIGALRWTVPAAGALLLVGLLGQLLLASLGDQFGIDRVTVTPEAVRVDAPEYSGVLTDGSVYHVWAASAEAAIGAADQIGLVDAALTLERVTGVTLQANAPEAVLDTQQQAVVIEGVAHVEDSTGTRGTLYRTRFNSLTQDIESDGPVTIDYADGTHLEAEGLVFDAQAQRWTFERARVILPDTPKPDAAGAGVATP